ncbi:MAG: hypothetical protein A2Y40_02405 [Candidatus Margulisbacteria bacterium GWF2_35_9]|nr:MAG: hypothetical protein A2Y40_02405 [Candidatus Margulisbacteria bacterium GWF2_35_9]
MNKVEQILKILSDKNRLRIYKMLEAKRCCVCEIAYVLQIKQPSVSQHLKKMKDAGLIMSEQEGLWTNYYLTPTSQPYEKILLSVLSEWLGSDEIIQKDIEQIKSVDREMIPKE